MKRFIGRVGPDPDALDGLAVFLDPLLARTPEIGLEPGHYTAYLHARTTAPVPRDRPVCRLIVEPVQPSDSIPSEHTVTDAIFTCGDLESGAAYRTVSLPFEMKTAGPVRLALDMLIAGHNDFFLDSLGIAGEGMMHRWSWDETESHLGVAIPDPAAV
ncbi:MAG TPA: hypothetical protein PLV45_16190, partial [bacterium]|nr:hypothetical protein [bacterium]